MIKAQEAQTKALTTSLSFVGKQKFKNNDEVEEEFIIEKVLDKRVDSAGKVKYFVKWNIFSAFRF